MISEQNEAKSCALLKNNDHSGQFRESHLLTYGVDVCSGDLVRSRYVVLQVNVLAQVHFASDGLEDEALLTAVGQGELDLAVQPARPEQSGIECVGAVGGHYHLHVHILVETIHLIEQFKKDTLDLTIS